MNTLLAGRDFGDCEIKSISFMDDAVYLRFFDPSDTAYFTVIFHAVEHLLFETSHLQNVIDSIRLFDCLEDMKSDPDAFGFFRKMEPSHSSPDQPLKFAYIVPITGGETLVSFAEFTIEE